MIRRILFTLFLQTALQNGPTMGTVTVQGHVFKADGTPLSGARVVVFPLEMGYSGVLPAATTDDKGAYKLSSQPYGKTRLIAIKFDEGYPDTTYAIYAPMEERNTEVMLRPGVVLTGVDIKLPPPDGRLQLTIVDANTGQSLQRCRIHLEREEEPRVREDRDCESSGLLIALPHRQIKIVVSSGGHQSTTVVDPITTMPFVDLQANENRKIRVEMKSSSIPIQ